MQDCALILVQTGLDLCSTFFPIRSQHIRVPFVTIISCNQGNAVDYVPIILGHSDLITDDRHERLELMPHFC